MKSKDKQKCKSKESTIGKIIYGFLLFMPLLAIGITCAYVIFNKNAYQSYNESQETQIVEISTNEQLINGQIYNINYTTGLSNGQEFYVLNGQSNIIDLYFPNQTWIVKKFQPYNENGRTRLIIYDTNNTQHNMFDWQNISNTFWFISNGNNTTTTDYQYYTITTTITIQAKLDNIFYYSIDKVEQNPLFNWAKNSILYTGMHNTAIQLDITTTFIPMLLTYWLIISVIYYLYDIILIILHIFHQKIHDLEESI